MGRNRWHHVPDGARSWAHDPGRRPRPAPGGPRARAGPHGRRGRGGPRRGLARAPLGRRAHAHRRRGHRLCPRRGGARAAAARRALHVRPPPGRDPLGAAQRGDPRRPRGGDRLRGDPKARLPARRGRRGGAGGWARGGVPWGGVAVTLAARVVLAASGRRSLNVEAAFQHIPPALFAFIATAIAGAVVLLFGFERADGIAALVVAALMLRSGVGLLRDSG